jgi:hypothetical protein
MMEDAMRMTNKRRRSSTKLSIPGGTWGVRTPKGIIIEGVQEGDAWKVFLGTIEDAELVNGCKVMSVRRGIDTVALPQLRNWGTMITQERAREIQTKAQDLATCGPWVDQVEKVVTPEEDAIIRQHWQALPMESSYMDSFYDFLNGTLGELGWAT